MSAVTRYVTRYARERIATIRYCSRATAAETLGFSPFGMMRGADPCFREAGAGGSNPLTPTIPPKITALRGDCRNRPVAWRAS
jgi:hypothetical protein